MRRGLLLSLVLLLAGCPTAREPVAPPAVRVGQRYRFEAGSPGLVHVHEVLAVSPEEVRYRVRTELFGEPLEPPVELTFSRLPGPALDEGVDEVRRVGAARYPCRVSEVDGLKRWVVRRRDDDHAEFPHAIRIEGAQEGVLLELVAVEGG